MPRVLMVTNVRSGGGTEKHVTAIAKALNIEVAYVEDGLKRLYRSIAGADLVHLYLPRSYIVGSLVAGLLGKRTIMSRRALTYGHHPIARMIEPLLHRRTDILVGNSPAVCKELQREAPNAKIRLIRNGIDFKPLPHRNSGKFTILCVANVWPHKHHETLIQAVQLIAPQLPDPWRLVLVGRDTEQFNHLPNVYGYGYRRDIPEILSTADVFVMPSCAEGCPNAVLEAMVAGVPVIAADAGGNWDAIEHGHTGVLVPPQQPERLAYAILAAARCPDQFRLMAENAKADIAKRFSMEACIEQYRKLYA